VNETLASQRARGMQDLLPDEMERVRAVETAFAQTCRAWGYREIRTPVIEPLHLFTAAGTLSPQTLDRVYSFLDWDGWSGERVVLRPDSTIPAARLYAERLADAGVAKLFYRQNIFRFTDDGTSREEWQCGAELFGETGPAGDIELVLMALDVLGKLRRPEDLTVRLSHAGLVRAVLASAGMTDEEQAAAYDRLLDGDLGVVEEVEARLPRLNAPLRLLFDVEGSGSGYIANVRSAIVADVPALAAPLDELGFIVAALEARGVTPIVQAALTRSFEYYSGMVMRIDVAGRRVCAGGRYDALVRLVGERDVPASGFAIYVTPLVEMMVDETPPAAAVRVDVRAAGDDARSIAAAHAAAAALRMAGIIAETTQPSAPVECTLECVGDGFRLRGDGAERTFKTLDDVLKALGAGR